MKRKTITTTLLALLLATTCTGLAFGANKEEVKTIDVQDSIINNIMTRTSIRSYQNKAVESSKIETLLRAGMAAPTAVNRQPWHFIVITDKTMLSSVAQTSPNAGMAAKAPLAIVVCGDMDKALQGNAREFWVQDASAATENILLAAHALGLGAVWTGTYPDAARCSKMSKLLGLPSNMIPLNTLVIGYPAENPQPKDKWKPENVSYNYFNGKEGSTAPVAAAPAEKQFKEFDVERDFRANPFTYFGGERHGMVLAAGDASSSNAMTIGWGGLGMLWGHNDAVTVYVAEKRYTKQFMDKCKYFTIMTFDKEHSNIPDYLGSHSGRDGDKAKALGLHTLYTENGTPYYAEAQSVIECELMYAAPFDKKGFKDIPAKLYSNFPSGVHSVYIGKVVKAMKKE
jgi:nitroreductase/flavin reductase (DIM6/NTAB) family NADH-FMN oxidoreductase RutF